MTVYKRGGVYRYDFEFRKQRYSGSTGQVRREDAAAVEAALKRRLRQRAAGIFTGGPEDTPKFQEWAEVYLRWKKRQLTDAQSLEEVLRVVLRFFGRRTAKNNKAGEPYHDLRLGDVVHDPSWLERFEQWMVARGVAGSTRNHYRSALSGMYRLATNPQFRGRTQIHTNPLAGVWRDPSLGREVALTAAQVRTWLTHASYHARLAVSIGALAPKLRLANILALKWNEHVDAGYTWITVHRHKTAVRTGRPLVIPISQQLKRILEDARRRQRGTGSHFVVTYRGRPITTLRNAIKAAAKGAKLPYGLKTENGVTFHSLRHTAATLLAELDVAEPKRQQVMGHSSIVTTQRYTHLRPVHLVDSVEQLSKAMPIEDVVTAPHMRVLRGKKDAVGKKGGPDSGNREES